MKKIFAVLIIVFVILMIVDYFQSSKNYSALNKLDTFEYVKFPLIQLKGFRIFISDVDNNGRNEIVISGMNRMLRVSEVRLIHLENSTDSKIFLGKNPGGILWVDDFNGDGYPDMVVHESNISGRYTLLHLLVNDGKGNLELQNSYEFANIDITRLSTILIHDKLKLVAGGYRLEDDMMKAFLMELNPQTNERRIIWEHSDPSNTALLGLTKGDFNGDGLEDFAAIVNNDYGKVGEVIILFNEGNGSFIPFKAFINPRYTYLITSGDFNNDGIHDIAINDVNEELHGRVVFLLMKEGRAPMVPEVKEYILNRGSFIDSMHGVNGTLWLGVTKAGRVPIGVLMYLNINSGTVGNIGDVFANSMIKDIKILEKGRIIFLLQDMDENEDFVVILNP